MLIGEGKWSSIVSMSLSESQQSDCCRKKWHFNHRLGGQMHAVSPPPPTADPSAVLSGQRRLVNCFFFLLWDLKKKMYLKLSIKTKTAGRTFRSFQGRGPGRGIPGAWGSRAMSKRVKHPGKLVLEPRLRCSARPRQTSRISRSWWPFLPPVSGPFVAVMIWLRWLTTPWTSGPVNWGFSHHSLVTSSPQEGPWLVNYSHFIFMQ